jgi:hypothetical protein
MDKRTLELVRVDVVADDDDDDNDHFAFAYRFSAAFVPFTYTCVVN